MINKKIESEIAISIIIVVAALMGGSVWLKNYNKYASSSEVRDKAEVGATDKVVFLGDSLTAIEDWNALFAVSYIANAGISGNTTDDLLSRIKQSVAYKPQRLFLMIGVNDFLRGKSIAYVMENYDTILNVIRSQSPDTMIYIESVLPINNDLSRIGTIDSQKIIDLNEKLKKFSKDNKAFFIDLYPAFCGEDNKLYEKYTVDGVHLSPAGYALWKNLISQYVNLQ